MKFLGILFLLAGVVCGVLGFSKNKESFEEHLANENYQAAKEAQSKADEMIRQANAAGTSTANYYNNVFAQKVEETEKTYFRYRSEREGEVKWLFISAVGIGILGLVLLVIPNEQKKSS
jgi:hypothetical protein